MHTPIFNKQHASGTGKGETAVASGGFIEETFFGESLPHIERFALGTVASPCPVARSGPADPDHS
jgi:hypothetical protein